ncbi:MAG: hypothetical protein ABFD52_06725 [Acidobacteriota bacterium]
MKKTAAIGSALLLAAFFAACAPATGIKTGAAAGEALIRMLPKSATGVAALDVRRLMGTEAVVKALQDPKAKEKLDEFVRMSGIDPTRDIFYIGAGLTGVPAGASSGLEGGVIISLKYDKARLQALIKAKAPEVKEEIYNGVTVYSNLDGGKGQKQAARAAFLDDSHIALGCENGLKGIIDVRMKKADSMARNAGMAPVLKKVDKSGILWGAFAVPQDLLKKGLASKPQLKMLEGVKALTLMFDDRVSGILAEIQTVGGTKEQNTNLAAALNGFKAMGAMFGANQPAVGEFLNGVQIFSGGDYTRLSISVSHEVMDKMGAMAKAKAGEFMNAKKKGEAPAPDVKK